MKKIVRIYILFIGLFTLGLITIDPSIAFATSDNSENNQLMKEKDAALRAGYTEEQFNQIMSIPNIYTTKNRRSLNIVSSMNNSQTQVINKAMEQLGKPYEWGAAGPDIFDCGGLVKYVYKQAVNIDLPMGTTNQEQYGTEVSLDALLPGDLLFYGSHGNTYHVGIYKGNGIMIHAPKPGETVREVNIQYFYPSFAKRILKDTPSGWNFNGKYWHYYYDDGTQAIGLNLIDGKRYSFDQNGALAINMWTVGDKYSYYSTDDGSLAVGLYWINGKRYSFDKNGALAINMWTVGDKYSYYSTDDGSLAVGLYWINGKRYSFDKNGALATNMWTVGDKYSYYSTDDGSLAVGYTSISNKLYIFDQNGALYKNSWVTMDSKKYYALENGELAIGTVEIDGTTYTFDDTGVLV